MAIRWKLKGDGRTIPPGEVVAPGERLTWPRTIGLGAQHVVAMFGATFVFPIIMGLNPQFAVMMSGIATIMFLLIVNGKVPSYLGTSASFVAAVAAIRLQGQGGSTSGLLDATGAVTPEGRAKLAVDPTLISSAQLHDSKYVTGAIMVAGIILLVVGVIVHLVGGQIISKILPPAVTGAVVMLIGFNLAPVVASAYWPKDQWVALLTMVFVIIVAVVGRGFWARIAILLGLIFGSVLSWVWDLADGGTRIDFTSVKEAKWFGFPTDILQHGTGADSNFITGALAGPHLPAFQATAILLVVPGVIALIAENTGHVKAVAEMTGDDLDPMLGRAFIGDGWGTTVAGFVGASPTTTYAENIGVMAATRVYSTAAYFIAALVAILFGFSPKFGALVSAVPGGVLGGITVVLYGMIGLLGAKIWVENRVDFGAPQNLLPLAAGIIIGIGGVSLKFSDNFEIAGIALGTIVVIVMYHVCRWLAPHLRNEPQAGGRSYVGGSAMSTGSIYDEGMREAPFRDDDAPKQPAPE